MTTPRSRTALPQAGSCGSATTTARVAGSVAVSPDGTMVYVAGSGYSGGGEYYATVAYRAATGRQLWVSRYHGPVNDGASAWP